MPKISVAGKGGTGKSVLTTLLAKAFLQKGYQVLIVDSDESNPGLYRMLGFQRAPADLMDFFGGPRRAMEPAREAGPLDPSTELKGLSLQTIPGRYLLAKDHLRLASVGKITGAFEGCACPLAEVLKTFLRRLFLQEREIVLVDMEAGVEHFGRGVEEYIDTILILVEPSFESIALAGKINLLARASGVKRAGAVINKVPSEEIGEKVKAELEKRNVPILGTVPYDEQVVRTCLEGGALEEGRAGESISEIADLLLRKTPAGPP